WSLYESSDSWVRNAREENDWGNNSFQLFVQIADNADLDAVNAKIKSVKYDHASEGDRELDPEIFLHPLKDWRLYSNWENGVQTGGQIQYVWLFGIVGAFVLLLACINFMNLSTARSEQRAKEVGIRKSIGSARKQLIQQFLCESVLVAVFAFIVALALVSVSLPWFNTLAQKQVELPLSNGYFWTISMAFVVVTGFMAGSYPALYLSSFQPVKVLKGTFRAGAQATLPRKVLVVLQFSVSITLIVGTMVVYRQIQFTKDRPIGYDRNGLVMIQMKSPDYYGKYDLLREELRAAGAIEEMAESSSPLTGHPQGPWRVGGESVADVIERLHCARDHLRRHIHAAGILRPGSLARRVRVSYKYFLDDLFDYRSGGVGHHVVHGEFSSHQGSVGKSGEVVEVGVILPFLLTWSHDLAT